MPENGPNRVMVIDDDPDILTIAALALETVGGFEIETCSSGRDALDRVGEFRPDVILLDATMPGMDGPETFNALSAASEQRDIPVVFFTGRTGSEDIDGFMELGAAGVVQKPFDPMLLAGTVRDIWKHACRQ